MLHLPGVLTPRRSQRAQAARHARRPGSTAAARLRADARDAQRHEQVDENSEDGRAIAALAMQAAVAQCDVLAGRVPRARDAAADEPPYAGDELRDARRRALMGGRDPLRTDLSGTLFLSDPADYDGGELLVDGLQGRQSAKLPAGDLVIYPSAQLHAVMPVTRGVRLACVFWVQSIVPNPLQRTLLVRDGAGARAAERCRGHASRVPAPHRHLPPARPDVGAAVGRDRRSAIGTPQCSVLECSSYRLSPIADRLSPRQSAAQRRRQRVDLRLRIGEHDTTSGSNRASAAAARYSRDGFVAAAHQVRERDEIGHGTQRHAVVGVLVLGNRFEHGLGQLELVKHRASDRWVPFREHVLS